MILVAVERCQQRYTVTFQYAGILCAVCQGIYNPVVPLAEKFAFTGFGAIKPCSFNSMHCSSTRTKLNEAKISEEHGVVVLYNRKGKIEHMPPNSKQAKRLEESTFTRMTQQHHHVSSCQALPTGCGRNASVGGAWRLNMRMYVTELSCDRVPVSVGPDRPT